MDASDSNAACVLLFDQVTGKALALDWQLGRIQLPGGKRELSDANIRVTAARELREETGFDIIEGELVYMGLAGDHFCTAFLAHTWSDRAAYDAIRWVDPIQLVDKGRFPAFYARMFATMARPNGAGRPRYGSW